MQPFFKRLFFLLSFPLNEDIFYQLFYLTLLFFGLSFKASKALKLLVLHLGAELF